MKTDTAVKDAAVKDTGVKDGPESSSKNSQNVSEAGGKAGEDANNLRDVYAQKALSQIPRILSNQDRTPSSPTYGCLHRDYWLDKTSDFPDAVRQFAVHALALVYKYEMPGNIYYQSPKVRDWTVAALDFWASIQHSDGSFDEFYPFERGWVGPTAFTSYTIIEALNLLGDEVPEPVKTRVTEAVRKAAHFIAAGESEEDHLANHHAMACLAVWKSYELLGDAALKEGFEKVFRDFLTYQTDEGWSVEYDGIDPGYLSATVSFFAKIYQTNPDPRILKVIRASIEMCAPFAYPNGFYAGSMGSRNTLHFYCHGFEVMADEVPLAGAIAEHLLQGLADDKLVPPEIISDRYLVYRVPEFLLAYLDYTPRPDPLPKLPFQREPYTEFFPGARVYVKNEPAYYAIANLAKGGVLKVFDKAQDGELVFNDCGLIGEAGGKTFTSQWIDPSFRVTQDEGGLEVSGNCQWVPSHKVFNLTKNLAFRGVLLLTGWSPRLSHLLKGQIRKTLMLGQRPAPLTFRRRVNFEGDIVTVEDEVRLEGDTKVDALAIGDEFFVRYVPQSRYFQSQELGVSGVTLTREQIATLNETRQFVLERAVHLNGKTGENTDKKPGGTSENAARKSTSVAPTYAASQDVASQSEVS